MIISKNKIIFLASAAIAAVFLIFYFGSAWVINLANRQPQSSPEPSVSASESPLPTALPSPSRSPFATKVPLPTGDNRTTFIDEAVPWRLLLGPAYCQLQGEIKFLNHNTYDNQDALFIYNGIDHPGRNILWTITPNDDLSVGPNMFGKLFLPNGESLLGVSLPENPKHKSYELTAKIQYGRLIDEKGNFVTVGGNVKVFEKQCGGKTTVVLP